ATAATWWWTPTAAWPAWPRTRRAPRERRLGRRELDPHPGAGAAARRDGRGTGGAQPAARGPHRVGLAPQPGGAPHAAAVQQRPLRSAVAATVRTVAGHPRHPDPGPGQRG